MGSTQSSSPVGKTIFIDNTEITYSMPLTKYYDMLNEIKELKNKINRLQRPGRDEK